MFSALPLLKAQSICKRHYRGKRYLLKIGKLHRFYRSMTLFQLFVGYVLLIVDVCSSDSKTDRDDFIFF